MKYSSTIKFIIHDWATNYLQHDGKFNYSHYGQNKGIPMEFDSFDDGWAWIDENIKSDDDESVDLWVIKNET